MRIFDFYLLKNLAIATIFIAVVLTFIIFLTQSLRFLDIVISAGSSGSTFWILTGLALPRFFEVILPMAILSATLFLYNKMTIDSELIAMRAIGHSSLALAKPARILGAGVTVLLWGITMWVAPKSLAQMHVMRSTLQTEFSAILFKEGVFNTFGNGLTVFIRQKSSDGALAGLMIHDTRDESKPPSTVMAKRGMIVAAEDGQQVIVFDGARHEYDQKTGILQKLAFERYTIDLPNSDPVGKRWAEPDERTIDELLHPNLSNARDKENLREFAVEVHRRFASPLLALAFPLIAVCAMVLGPTNRRGHAVKIGIAVLSAVLIQGLFLTVYNLAAKNDIGLILMYGLVFMPIIVAFFLLSGFSEALRRRVLYSTQKERMAT